MDKERAVVTLHVEYVEKNLELIKDYLEKWDHVPRIKYQLEMAKKCGDSYLADVRMPLPAVPTTEYLVGRFEQREGIRVSFEQYFNKACEYITDTKAADRERRLQEAAETQAEAAKNQARTAKIQGWIQVASNVVIALATVGILFMTFNQKDRTEVHVNNTYVNTHVNTSKYITLQLDYTLGD